MIVIMGATGHTGGRIAHALLGRRERVRVIGRDAGKLKSLADQGAETAVGDATDAGFLTRAFTGADTAYTLLPPDLTSLDVRAFQDQVGEATMRALRGAAVTHLVFLSSQGADLPSGTGPIAGLHAQEERLRQFHANVLILRPGYFFENFYATLGLIKQQGINGGAMAPDIEMAMIATRDIADVAAASLAARDFSGIVVRDLLGPRDMTFAEATRIIGREIGKAELEYVQFPYDAFQESLLQMGASKDVARSYAEMARAFNEGRIRPAGRTAASTTPSTFESFAEELGKAYRRL